MLFDSINVSASVNCEFTDHFITNATDILYAIVRQKGQFCLQAAFKIGRRASRTWRSSYVKFQVLRPAVERSHLPNCPIQTVPILHITVPFSSDVSCKYTSSDQFDYLCQVG